MSDAKSNDLGGTSAGGGPVESRRAGEHGGKRGEPRKRKRNQDHKGGNDSIAQAILASFPRGLVKSLRNLQDRSQRLNNLYLGLVDKSEVVKRYRDTVSKMTGRYLALRNIETNEIRRVPVRSRWNSKWKYQKKVWRQLMEEVKGLHATKMLTLTFDPKRVEAIMPDLDRRI